MASNNKQGGGNKAAAAPDHQQDEEFDPDKFEWIDNANHFLLRLTLTGCKKEDFRVQVDGTGKLTVRGQRPGPATAAAKHIRFHKVFQLPSNASIDDIAGRFESNVLTITVPKKPAAAAPPTTVQEIKQHTKPTKQEDDEAKKKKKLEEDEAKKKKQEEEEEEEARKKKKQEEEEAIAKKGKQEHKPATERKEQDKAAPALVDRERAKAKAEAEEKTSAFSGWRERVAGDRLADMRMRWADGLVETARRNKEVIATAVAAFSVGFVVSKLLCRR